MDDEKYKAIIIIMTFLLFLPLTLVLAVSPLTVLHIYPIALRLKKMNKFTVSPKDYTDTTVVTVLPKQDDYDKKVMHRNPLIFASVGISIGFLIIHIFSIIEYTIYAKEVLSTESYHNKLPIMHGIFSLLAIAIGFILTQKILSDNSTVREGYHEEQRHLRIPVAVISVNIIYIGCYFLPYMLLAFIHDPILTVFTYFMVVLFIVCVYLICLGVFNLHKFYKRKHGNYEDSIKCAKFLTYLLYSCMAWAMATSIIIFLVVITYIIALGGFDDFEELKILVPSLLIGVIGLFLLRPALTFISKKYKEHSSKDQKEQKEEKNTVTVINNDQTEGEQEESDNHQTQEMEQVNEKSG